MLYIDIRINVRKVSACAIRQKNFDLYSNHQFYATFIDLKRQHSIQYIGKWFNCLHLHQNLSRPGNSLVLPRLPYGLRQGCGSGPFLAGSGSWKSEIQNRIRIPDLLLALKEWIQTSKFFFTSNIFLLIFEWWLFLSEKIEKFPWKCVKPLF